MLHQRCEPFLDIFCRRVPGPGTIILCVQAQLESAKPDIWQMRLEAGKLLTVVQLQVQASWPTSECRCLVSSWIQSWGRALLHLAVLVIYHYEIYFAEH